MILPEDVRSLINRFLLRISAVICCLGLIALFSKWFL